MFSWIQTFSYFSWLAATTLKVQGGFKTTWNPALRGLLFCLKQLAPLFRRQMKSTIQRLSPRVKHRFCEEAKGVRWCHRIATSHANVPCPSSHFKLLQASGQWKPSWFVRESSSCCRRLRTHRLWSKRTDITAEFIRRRKSNLCFRVSSCAFFWWPAAMCLDWWDSLFGAQQCCHFSWSTCSLQVGWIGRSWDEEGRLFIVVQMGCLPYFTSSHCSDMLAALQEWCGVQYCATARWWLNFCQVLTFYLSLGVQTHRAHADAIFGKLEASIAQELVWLVWLVRLVGLVGLGTCTGSRNFEHGPLASGSLASFGEGNY